MELSRRPARRLLIVAAALIAATVQTATAASAHARVVVRQPSATNRATVDFRVGPRLRAARRVTAVLGKVHKPIGRARFRRAIRHGRLTIHPRRGRRPQGGRRHWVLAIRIGSRRRIPGRPRTRPRQLPPSSPTATPTSTLNGVLPGQLMSSGGPDWSTLSTDKEKHWLISANPWWVTQAHTFQSGHDGRNKAIAYQNAHDCRYGFGTANDGSGAHLSASGVSCQQADAAKAAGDDWYLHRPDGSIQKSNWNQPVMDVGDPDYQKAWADNVISRVTRFGWSGVFIDDVNAQCNCSNGLPVEYPTTDSWRVAMDRFVAYTSQRLRTAGIRTALPNIGFWLSDLDRGCRWAASYGGAFEEHYGQFGDFASNRRRMECSNANGGEFFGSTLDSAIIRYTAGLGLLFGQRGRTFIGLAAGDDHGHFQWDSAYDDMQRVGQPTGAAFQLADGRWRRNFANGYVIVTPSTKATSIVVQ